MPARLKHYFPPLPALALYLATAVSEVPVIFTRMLAVIAIAAFVLLVRDGSATGADGYAQLGLIPTGWAMFALLTPFGGGLWWRTNLGGRSPSLREHAAYRSAMEQLRRTAAVPFADPSGWFVLDTPELDACVCGNTLALSRGLFESSHLPAVLAHELGHLNTSDGRLTAAINRMVINTLPWRAERPPRQRGAPELHADDRVLLTVTFVGLALWAGRKALAFAKGGLGLKLLGPFWGSYWREREYLADRFAASLGEGDSLADFLELHALVHDQPLPFIWATEHTHPPTELRIERLRTAQRSSALPEALAPVASGIDPFAPEDDDPQAA
jgi:Zn-dependent protease with chaperone function